MKQKLYSLFLISFLVLAGCSHSQDFSEPSIKEDVSWKIINETQENDQEETSQVEWDIVVDNSWVDEFADWSGEYYRSDNTFLWILWPDEEGGVDFEIGFEDLACYGFSALANLEKSGVANYYSDTTECHINLTYNPGRIELSSYDCSDFETEECLWFSWEYILR